VIFQVPLPHGRFQSYGPQYLTGALGVDKFLRAAPLAAVPAPELKSMLGPDQGSEH